MISGSPLPQRLDKILRDRTGLSLKVLKERYEQGRIGLSRSAPDGMRELIFEADRLTLDGEPLSMAPRGHLYFALNKPLGIITTAKSPDGLPDLRPWLDTLPPSVFPVGRLDRMTSGLLLLINDGDLAHALLSPSHHVKKEYRAVLRDSIAPDDPRLQQLLQPMRIDQQTLRACEVELSHSGANGSCLRIVLEEGKHRQIRKMCHRAGLKLVALHRHRIGPVILDDLPTGTTRPLNDQEVLGLWQAVGGREHVRLRQVSALVRLLQQRRLHAEAQQRLEQWLAENGVRVSESADPPTP